MTTLKLVVLAGLGSLFLLTGALLFQYIGNMHPCKMCYWQRYPHLLAVAISILYFFTRIYRYNISLQFFSFIVYV